MSTNINMDFEKLLNKIMLRIKKEQKILALKRMLIFSLTSIISVAVFVWALKTLGVRASESGFWQFFSLLFSDFKIVATYWKTFALSLLESLPVISLAVLFLAIFGFLESLKFLFKDIKQLTKLKIWI